MSGYRDIVARAARLCVPISALFELTYRCSQRCVHCFQDRAAAPDELSEHEWLDAVEQVRGLGALTVTLSGGEALMSRYFWAVAERARQRGMALRVMTNGLLLSNDVVRRLAALRPAAVEVSVFAVSPGAHDAVTGLTGSFSRALRGLVRLKRSGVPTIIKTPLLDSSGRGFARVRRLAERLGASHLFDPGIFPRTDGGTGPTRCRGADDLLIEYFADPSTVVAARAIERPIPAESSPCGIGRTFLAISPRGDVLACPVLPVAAGNLQDRPLAEIWKNAPLFEKLRAARFGELRTCGTCPRSGYCHRCGAMAYLEDGDFFGPSSRACHLASLKEKAKGVPPPPNAPAPPEPCVPRRPILDPEEK